MSDKPISPLRQRMIDDMTARRVKEKVQKDYVRHVRTFAAFLGRSPDTATSEDLRRFQVHLAKQQIGVATINAAIAALRFFFNVTLERPDLVRHLTTVNQPRRAPVVLSQEEVFMHYPNRRVIALGNGLDPQLAFEGGVGVVHYRIDRWTCRRVGPISGRPLESRQTIERKLDASAGGMSTGSQRL